MSNPTRRRYLSRKVCFIIILVAAPILLFFEFAKPAFTGDSEIMNPMINMTITRGVGALVFLALLLSEGYRILNPLEKPFWRSLLFAIPPLLVAINNAPLYCLFFGDGEMIHGEASYWVMFILECLAIGLFEEFAFRGVIFLMLAEKRHTTRKGLFISLMLTSAIFGAVHLVNLFAGAGIGGVILQIGYSFLIGAMCSVVLLKTRNIWLCVLLHAVYDFGGKIIPTLFKGTMWDTPTVIVTAVLAVLTAAYLIWQFFVLDLGRVREIYEDGHGKRRMMP